MNKKANCAKNAVSDTKVNIKAINEITVDAAVKVIEELKFFTHAPSGVNGFEEKDKTIIYILISVIEECVDHGDLRKIKGFINGHSRLLKRLGILPQDYIREGYCLVFSKTNDVLSAFTVNREGFAVGPFSCYRAHIKDKPYIIMNYDHEGKPHGPAMEFYEDGSLKLRREYKHGVLEGFEETYYDRLTLGHMYDKRVKSRASYIAGRLMGYAEFRTNEEGSCYDRKID